MENRSNMINISLATAVLILDRITKNYAIAYFLVPKKITSFLTLELVMNTGISWGIFHAWGQNVFYLVTIGVSIVTASVLLHAYKQNVRGAPVLGHVLVVAGSLSNIYDRIVYSAVVDFIYFHTDFLQWPLFNIADVCIVIGVVIMFLHDLRVEQ